MAQRLNQKIGGQGGPFSDGTDKRYNKPYNSGVFVPKSPCCGAPVVNSNGGVYVKICQECGKAIPEKLIG